MATIFRPQGPAQAPMPVPIQQAYANDPRQAMAAELIARGTAQTPVWNNTQGFARLATALLGGYQKGQVRREYQGQADAYRKTLSEAIAAMGSEGGSDRAAQILAGNNFTADLGLNLQLEELKAQRALEKALALRKSTATASKPIVVAGGDRTIVMSPDGSQVLREIPFGVSPDVNFRQTTPSADAQLRANTQLQTHVAPSGSAQLQADVARQKHQTPSADTQLRATVQRDIASDQIEQRESAAQTAAEARRYAANKSASVAEDRLRQLPPNALKQQGEQSTAIGGVANVNNRLADFEKKIDDGKLDLGPFANLMSGARNMTNTSTEVSRNFASFKNTLEELRNQTLLLAKGVQTEGDANRAWQQLVTNLNDEKYVKSRLKEIRAINEKSAQLQLQNYNRIQANYGRPPASMSEFMSQFGNQGAPQQKGLLDAATQQPKATSKPVSRAKVQMFMQEFGIDEAETLRRLKAAGYNVEGG